jgi:tRNA pseudouridine55 synthase
MRGVLNVNKPSGITSYDVIRRLKPLFNTRRLGHAGTLDPLASGVLLILVNEATKIADYLQIPDKEYVAEIRLGIRTDTDDITGRVLAEKPVAGITREQVLSALAQFKGEIEQVPPDFSALKVRGERSYRLARKGETVEHAPRKVTVRELELVELRTADYGLRGPMIRLRAVVSSGTYVRALARDLGEKLGCGATLQSLVRTRVGEFLLENAVVIEDPDLVSRLIPVPKALAFLPGATVVADAVPRLLSGQALANDEVRMTSDNCAAAAHDSPVVVQDEAQRVLFIAQYSDGKLKPKRGIYADV